MYSEFIADDGLLVRVSFLMLALCFAGELQDKHRSKNVMKTRFDFNYLSILKDF
jgi:hypothetical protein